MMNDSEPSPRLGEDSTPGIHPLFQRDVFRISGTGGNQKIFDEDGQHLMTVQLRSPVFRTAAATAASILTAISVLGISIVLILVGIELLGIEHGPDAELYTVIAAGMAFSCLLSALVGFKVHTLVLGGQQWLFHPEDSDEPVLEIRQRRTLGPTSIYDVYSDEDNHLASLRRNFLYNCWRERWKIVYTDDMTSAIVEEDARMPRAIRITLRSLLGIMTLAGLLIGLWLVYKVFVAGGFFLLEGVFALVTLLLWPLIWLTQRMNTNMYFKDSNEFDVVGEFNRCTDHVDRPTNDLDLSADTQGLLDPRVALATAVMFDTQTAKAKSDSNSSH